MRLRVAAVAAGLASILAGVAIGLRRGPDQIVFLNVGQGDATAIIAGNTGILIDAGPNSHGWDAGERVVKVRLHALGVRHVPCIILSHPDEDHIGGVASVLRAFPGAKLILSSAFRAHPDLVRYLADWRVAPGQVIFLTQSVTMRFADVQIRVASSPWQTGRPDNEGSLFTHIQMPGLSAVVSGDASGAVEYVQSLTGAWRADVLLVGHHGSRSSMSDRWLDAVQPRLAVISCGRDNNYGHPDPSTLVRLSRRRVKVRRTDTEGEIRVVSGSLVR